MKRRIAIWASVGFLVACGWVLYTFLTPPEQLLTIVRQPLVQAVACASCPLIVAARHLPLRFWWFPPINAATYMLIGLIAELLVALTRLCQKNAGLAA